VGKKFPFYTNRPLTVLDITSLKLLLKVTVILIIIPSNENKYALYPYSIHIDVLLMKGTSVIM
jgi:hypothetical protein